MKIDYSQIHLCFITETDNIARTDEKYLRKFLKVHYSQYSDEKVHTTFINVGGNSKIATEETKIEVRKARASIFGKPYFVVLQCFDRDRKRKDKTKVDKLIEFANSNQYIPVIFSKNIEDVFKPTGSGTKAQKAQNFYSSEIKPSQLDINLFTHSIDDCCKRNGISNLDSELKKLFKRIK